MMASPFRRVLVGWDGSADAAEALSTAVSIAGRDGGHVVAISVVRGRPHAEADDGQEDDQADVRDRAEAIFERLRQQDPSAGGVRMSMQIVAGNESKAGSVVCAYAAEHGFDLLVLGRHGEGGAARMRLGRVAEKAAHASTVPVLLLGAPR